jgi:hypothetical protein
MKSIILPGDLEFDQTIANTLPPDWQLFARNDAIAHAIDVNTGLLKTVTEHGLREYLNGGEYDQRMRDLGYDDDWEFKPYEEELGEWVSEESLEPDEFIHTPYAI